MKPSIAIGGELISPGEHVLKLQEVKEQVVDNKWSDQPDTKTTKWVWEFITSGGESFSYWTGTSYGNAKANLTTFLDRLVPLHAGDKAFFADFDVDCLIGQEFKAMIEHRKADSGNIYPFLAYIAPIGHTAPVATPEVATAAVKPKMSPRFAKTVSDAVKALVERGKSEDDAKTLARDNVPPGDQGAADDFLTAVKEGLYDEEFIDPFAAKAA